MPANNVFSFETSLIPAPPPPPDTARTYAIVAPATPAGVTAKASVYSTAAEMEDDGWGTSFVAYNAAARAFSQEPAVRPVSSLIVIRRETAVANVWTVDIVSTSDGNHQLFIGGVLAGTFAAAANTAEAIKTGLIAAFNAGPFAASQTAASVDTATLSITADVAGVPFVPTATVPAGDDHVVAQTVANVGIYEDLEAAHKLFPFWGAYAPGALASEYNEALRWVEINIVTRRNFLFAELNDAAIYDADDTDNIAVQWLTAKRTRVNLLSHPNATEYMQLATLGRLGGGFPGSRASHYIALGGSTESDVTANRTFGQVLTLQARAVSRTERLFGPRSDLLLLAEKPNIPAGVFVYQRQAEDHWWFTIRAAIDFYMKLPAGVDLDEDGLEGLANFVSVAMIPLLNEGVIADDYVVGFTPLADVPLGERAIGDFKSTGALTAEATITPKLRSLRVRANFALA